MRFLRRLTRRFRFHLSWQRLTPPRFRHYKVHSQLVLLCLSVTIFLNILYGVYLGRFSFRRKKFVFCKIVTAYCVTMGTIFGIFYTWRIYEEVTSGQLTRSHTIEIYCYMNVCVCLINYVTQWPITFRIVRFQNSVKLFTVLNQLEISMSMVWKAFSYSIIKMIVCPLVEYISLILYQRRAHPELHWTNMATVKTMLPVLVSNQINNCFFGGLVIANLIVAAINRTLMAIVKESNMLQTPAQLDLHKPYYRMRRFCELADGLDELANMYSICATRSKDYLRFTDCSMVLSMLMNLIGITLGFFNQYMAIADHYINEEPFDLYLAVVLLIFLSIPFLELVIVARISNQMLLETQKTGELLQRINLQHADIRFKQVVKAFWLRVSTINYKLMPLGLLELNTTLVNTVFSSVIGFLLILVQSDLTLRFSLK
ncbi:hypothetical protein KR018_001696 [Drosophila ironensis]|nr:hypothetical protein KR018_001696 [Drosophila ironensis]